MYDLKDQVTAGASLAWANTIAFLPKLLVFLVIAIGGYYLSKFIAKLLDRVLERVGFDTIVERGEVKQVLSRTRYDASDLLSKIVFYTIFLFVLQLAFGIFGPNPVSDLLTRVVAFLPNIFVAIVIVVVAAAVARAVKDILGAMLAGLSYGRTLAKIASALIMVVGVFAALNQLQIAPAIVNGLFYAGLAIVAGSAIIAIGGGGIQPMRTQWEKALRKVENDGSKFVTEAQTGAHAMEERAQAWKKPSEPAPRMPSGAIVP